ncbi:hypothetical protein HMPREF9714_01464 [Myroides odoratimimus CCUG 12901]|uniref:DUF4838 domain-containing protein n=1 Tax=Myroides odoratimimus TaxID=76832 RepID=UPI0002460B54|nr:DUF4838 domain-containing protein [Myroides odoratimimus]EHO10500.1 hypothetical protein HMPREF9714_01464 [Myroides odoratimimus CCUG 12901]MCA4807310.1 DUF4838 domain-containing protein [Myroides odoratimimus]MDM1400878.1 DUF4838 domain-containing protein [Myroides odoratimimus]MDM1452769.1 DUF4838 domain-containing protein [Myroides odoratimimus]MDM1463874.1 DUF4838 domain-containing protein [Myroides odoratimimus]
MWFSNIIKYSLLSVLCCIYGCKANTSEKLSSEYYVIHADDVFESKLWADYLYKHLMRRTSTHPIVEMATGNEEQDSAKHIYITMDETLEHDYCIQHDHQGLRIKARDGQTIKWVIYQLIEAISEEDSRFLTADLPPAILDFVTGCSTNDFTYREPHYLENLLLDQSGVLGNNNVEEDWGIWGHNIAKAIPSEPKSIIYARVNEQVNRGQFCFTSGDLYAYLSEYIIDNYGYGIDDSEHYRFVIAPNDNAIVCSCGGCLDLNKSTTQASESVAHLINKLARRFPKYEFYMLAYLSTKTVPNMALEPNVGVMISTIDIPKGVALKEKYLAQKNVQGFISDIKTWRTKTNKVLLWDYSSNFDDYLSPIPILYGLQHQFKFFKNLGVQGIFLNASGYDYSSFSDVQNYVATTLLKDIDADVEELIRSYFKKVYPKSGDLLSTYYIRLEKRYNQANKPYSMYGSPEDNFNNYLDPQEFIHFYQSLAKQVLLTSGEERKKLDKLYTALTFTRLQLAYYRASDHLGAIDVKGNSITFKQELKNGLEVLNLAKERGILKYKEAEGNVDNYLTSWREIIAKEGQESFLLLKPIIVKNSTGKVITSSTLLSNGLLGFRTDYHLGWYISPENKWSVEFNTTHIEGVKTLALRFLLHKKHQFESPALIELRLDGNLVKTIDSASYHLTDSIAEFSTYIDFNQSEKMEIVFTKKEGSRVTIALDEIQITN